MKHLLGEDHLLLALTLYTHLGDEVQQKVCKGRAQDQLKGLWGRASVRAQWSWKQLLGGKGYVQQAFVLGLLMVVMCSWVCLAHSCPAPLVQC